MFFNVKSNFICQKTFTSVSKVVQHVLHRKGETCLQCCFGSEGIGTLAFLNSLIEHKKNLVPPHITPNIDTWEARK